ncbi:50S ribosomal protein L32e [Candidatus Woesearchaeota archaeon]|nr:50S ribosomal protein L32e [Candidatus Woesearchaeota archaeon]
MVDTTKKLLETRKAAKKRKPTFCRRDASTKPRISGKVWRKARGSDNKQRQKFKGRTPNPNPGYRSPVAVRGLDRSGLWPVLVFNVAGLEAVSKEEGIIIASSVGGRKRKEIIDAAAKKSIKILNIDAKKELEKIDAKLKARKADKQKADEKKRLDEKAKKEEKKLAPKKEKEEELSEKEKKEEEKKEKDKVLIHNN